MYNVYIMYKYKRTSAAATATVYVYRRVSTVCNARIRHIFTPIIRLTRLVYFRGGTPCACTYTRRIHTMTKGKIAAKRDFAPTSRARALVENDFIVSARTDVSSSFEI